MSTCQKNPIRNISSPTFHCPDFHTCTTHWEPRQACSTFLLSPEIWPTGRKGGCGRLPASFLRSWTLAGCAVLADSSYQEQIIWWHIVWHWYLLLDIFVEYSDSKIGTIHSSRNSRTGFSKLDYRPLVSFDMYHAAISLIIGSFFLRKYARYF